MLSESESAMDIVINASPLILLNKVNRLSLLNKLFTAVYIPNAVLREVGITSELEPNVDFSEISFRPLCVTNEVAVQGLLGRLHIGEVEVIVGAIEKGISTVVLDENAARNKAKHLGLYVTGTLGILMKAKKCGLIDDISAEITNLKNANMYVSDEVVKRLIALCDL